MLAGQFRKLGAINRIQSLQLPIHKIISRCVILVARLLARANGKFSFANKWNDLKQVFHNHPGTRNSAENLFMPGRSKVQGCSSKNFSHPSVEPDWFNCQLLSPGECRVGWMPHKTPQTWDGSRNQPDVLLIVLVEDFEQTTINISENSLVCVALLAIF